MPANVETDFTKWRKFVSDVAAFAGAHVKVGVLASRGGLAKAGSSSGQAQGGDISMIELAAIHEFGSPAAGIPERSFIRRTFHEQLGELALLLEKLARAVASGKMKYDRALHLLGLWGVSQVRHTVVDSPGGVPPPLKQATIDRKGSERPLVDTGRLINAVSYEVVDGVAAVLEDEGIEGTE